MARSWTIGSKSDCDLVVNLPKVSGHHCRLTRDDNGYVLEDLGSTNGTYLDGVRVVGSVRVKPGDAITLGLTVPMPWPSETPPPGSIVCRIGREPDNDFVVDQPVVSSYHARIIWEGKPGEALIEDLGSSNGTALGSPDRKITRSVLSATDTIYLGTHPVPAAEVLARIDRSGVPTLTFQGSSMVIGRDPDCDRVLDSPVVSGHHARVARSASRIVIEDLGSSNGTFVNGQRVNGTLAVKDGDLISLGSYTIVFNVGAAHAADEQARAIDETGLTAPGRSVTDEAPTPWWTDVTQEFASSLRHPWRLAALLVQAPLLAFVIVMALRTITPVPTAPEGWVSASRTIAAILSWLGLAAIWFGLSNAVLGNLLSVTRVRKGLQPRGAAALFSRLSVLGALCVCQCAIAWAIVRSVAGLQGAGLPSLGLLILASAVGLALGLLIVVVAAGRHRVAWAVLALAMPALWLLGGAYQPLPRMPSWASAASNMLPTRWAFEGLLLLESDRYPKLAAAEGPDPARNHDLAEDFFPADSERMGTRADAMALATMLVGLATAACFISMVPKPKE
jgi:pSer/pThr/pTyr-binding forkhead associated (FHA) protein